MTSEPTPVAQSIGAIEMMAAPSVKSFGRSRWTAPSRMACLSSAMEPMPDSPPRSSIASRRYDEHHHARLDRHAEAGDVSDLDRDAEAEAEEPLEDCPAGERPEDARHHQEGVRPTLVGEVEDEHDGRDDRREDEPKRLLCPDLMLERPRPFEIHPRREVPASTSSLE